MAEDTQGTGETIELAYRRFGTLMLEMRKAAAAKDKATLIHLSESLAEHGDDVTAWLFDEAGVNEKDIQQFGSSHLTDALLVKLASKPEGEQFLKRTSEADSRRD